MVLYAEQTGTSIHHGFNERVWKHFKKNNGNPRVQLSNTVKYSPEKVHRQKFYKLFSKYSC